VQEKPKGTFCICDEDEWRHLGVGQNETEDAAATRQNEIKLLFHF